MTIERALFSYLTGNPGVAALLSQRLYPETAPENRVLPYVTYTQGSERPIYSMGGFAGLRNVRIALDVWTDTQPSREAIGAALQAALHAWGQESREGVAIRRVAVVDEVDAYIPPTDGSERGVYQRTLDVDIWYRTL